MALRPPPPSTQLGRSLELGIQIALSVVLGVGLGYYADRRLGTEPVFLFLFLVLGFATAIRIVIRFVQDSMPGTGPDKPNDKGPRSPGG